MNPFFIMQTKFYSKLIRSGSFNQFALNFVDNKRQELAQKYPTEKAFIQNFKIDDALLDEFINFAKEKKAEPDSAEVYTNSIPTIKNQLKGLIGQNLFNYNIYYQITNPQNPIYAKALAAFSDGSFKKFGILQPAEIRINNSKKQTKAPKTKK